MNTARDFDTLLSQAAAASGIEATFWDIWGKEHVTTPHTMRAILRAQGWPVESPEQLRQALHERSRDEWTRLAPDCVVTLESEPRKLTVRLAAEALHEPLNLTIRREDGSSATSAVQPEPSHSASVDVDGRKYVEAALRLPGDLGIGYHEIEVSGASGRSVTRYIVAPARAHANPVLRDGRRAAGFAVTLYSLRSGRNWGCGDFTDLQDLCRWAASELRVAFVALNPLHAIHNRRPFNTSPYLPNCIFYRNLLYLDVESIVDYQECARAQRLRVSQEVQSEIEALRASEFVEYERVHALKLQFLKMAFARFLRTRRSGGERAAEFDAYCDREGDLLTRYATYCALDESLHKQNPDLWVWTNWPAEYQDPDSPAVADFARRHWRAVLFHKYAQWQIAQQLEAAHAVARGAGMPIGLYHDLALATDRFGSDMWAHREFFANSARVGSPPDDFSPKGQDWAFPPPSVARHRQDGYRLFAETIRKNCRPGGALRMDHVMRLFRLYWIPDGVEATDGAYVKELCEDFVRVLALESVRARVTLVGEDLGTVAPNVREVLTRMGILSYRLLMFEKNGDGSFRRSDEYPGQALVSSTTHDLPTIAGFWQGADIEARRAANTIDDDDRRRQWEARMGDKQRMLDALFAARLMPDSASRDASHYPELTSDLQRAIIGYIAQTPSQLFCLNQEDLTREPNQQNLPGTTWQYPNWARKMRWTVEDLQSCDAAHEAAAMARAWIEASGRA